MKKAKKLLTVMLCAVLCMNVVAVSAMADHECSSEDCRICAVLSQYRSFLAPALGILIAIAAPACAGKREIWAENPFADCLKSLFSRKTELLD